MAARLASPHGLGRIVTKHRQNPDFVTINEAAGLEAKDHPGVRLPVLITPKHKHQSKVVP